MSFSFLYLVLDSMIWTEINAKSIQQFHVGLYKNLISNSIMMIFVFSP